MCEHEFMKPPLWHSVDSSGSFKLITKPICVHCWKTEDEINLETKLDVELSVRKSMEMCGICYDFCPTNQTCKNPQQRGNPQTQIGRFGNCKHWKGGWVIG